MWIEDKFDHAAIETIFDLEISKSRGLLRPDTGFLDIFDLANDFRGKFLEMIKTGILTLKLNSSKLRILPESFSKNSNNNLNRKLESTRFELNKFLDLKYKLLSSTGSSPWEL